MKTLIDPKHHDSILAQWSGSEAKVWIFHVTHNRMAIMLSRTGQQEAVYVVALGCERLSGPFSWKEANLSIVTEPPNQWEEVRRHILDKQAGFDLLCSDVAVFCGPPAVPDDPFENFAGDAK